MVDEMFEAEIEREDADRFAEMPIETARRRIEWLEGHNQRLLTGDRKLRDKLAALQSRLDASGISSVPCCKCGGVVTEFSIPNDIWNRVIRKGGPETDQEYLCVNCFANIAAEYLDASERARVALLEALKEADKTLTEVEDFVEFVVIGKLNSNAPKLRRQAALSQQPSGKLDTLAAALNACAKKMSDDMIDMPPEFAKHLDENFMDYLSRDEQPSGGEGE